MAKRIILNETSYHGRDAIKEIINEIRHRNFRKAFIMFRSRAGEARCCRKSHRSAWRRWFAL